MLTRLHLKPAFWGIFVLITLFSIILVAWPSLRNAGQSSGGLRSRTIAEELQTRSALRSKRSDEANQRESFAFMGFERFDRVPSPGNKKGTGASKKSKPGVIPQLDIELGRHKVEDVALRFGFALVLSTDSLILGKVVDGKVVSMSKAELNKYSTRAREAYALQDYDRIVAEVVSSVQVAPEKVRLIFLVPRTVESFFTRRELEAIEQSSLRTEDVDLVIGGYTDDFDVKIKRLIKKDGTVLHLGNG